MTMMTVAPLDIGLKNDDKRNEAEAHHYTVIKVARDEDLRKQIGRDIFFDLVDHNKVRSFRIQNQTPFRDFKEEIAREFGVPVLFQRFWIWAKRQNNTYRPRRPLTQHEEAQSVGQVREVSNKTHGAELKLFLEVELGLVRTAIFQDLRPIAPPDKTNEDILLFLKLYDPENGKLRYVGRLFVKSSSMPMEILTKLNQMAGFSPNEEIELYEEIKFEPCLMCEPIDKMTSFRLSQLEDGDIVCLQKASLKNEAEHLHPDVPSFLEYVRNRQIVHFRSLEKPTEDDDSDLALFESIGITFPISWSTTFDTPTSSATNAKIPTSKRAEILKALSTVVCYLHSVRDLKDVDLNAEPPLEVAKALETLKAQGSDLLPKEKITMISKMSTDLARIVSRYKVRHDLLQGIAKDKKDTEACNKAFNDADAIIKTMSTDYWQARQQRDAKRKEFTLAQDKVFRLQAELARGQEQASELQSQLAEAEQRRLTSFRACADFKDTVYESARIERERVAQSLELNKALYAQEKDDLDNAHDFLLDVISCLDSEVEASWPGSGIPV